jgi:hypothetical protein
MNSRRFPVAATAVALALILAGSSLVLGACGGDDEADVRERLDERGTAELMDDIEDDEYQPPTDGELSDQQLAMFLEVRERALEIRRVAQENLEGRAKDEEGNDKEMSVFGALGALGDAGDYATADLRAADELGHNTAEYEWVEETVVQALANHWARQAQVELTRAMSAGRGQIRAQMETMLAATDDPEQKREIEEALARMDEGEAAGTFDADGLSAAADDAEMTDAERHNQDLVLEHEADIRAALMPEESAFIPSRKQLEGMRDR